MLKNLQKYLKLLFALLIIINISLAENSPKRIILNLTENPDSEMAVTWRTCEPVDKAISQITKANPSINLEATAKTIAANTESLQINEDRTVYHHSVILKNLIPATTY